MSEKSDSLEKTVITSVEQLPTTDEKNAYILFLSGPLVGKICLLEEGSTTLGRAPDAGVSVNDVRISRHHITIDISGDEAVIRDMNSTNGTFINGQRIKEKRLEDGDKIQISSSTIFKFAYQDNVENVFHKELYKMAVLDAVTGIYNKRFFLDRLKEEFSHAKRFNIPLSLLMMDVDFFKKVNDTHGHLAGDCALGYLAKILKEMVRGEDVVARYGGEEFSVILRGTPRKGAHLLAERIRKQVETHPCAFEDKKMSLTISFGVATLESGNYKTYEAFIEASDKALYTSKHEGRNRTTMA